MSDEGEGRRVWSNVVSGPWHTQLKASGEIPKLAAAQVNKKFVSTFFTCIIFFVHYFIQ